MDKKHDVSSVQILANLLQIVRCRKDNIEYC